MKKPGYYHSLISAIRKVIAICFFLTISSHSVDAQTNVTIPSGSFIVNMGVVPQTAANGLVPYGMIYDLLKNYMVPVDWVINTGKAKDGTDFTYNGVNYCGGPFIIEARYITATISARIAYWQTQGVIGLYTTSAVTVPLYLRFYNAPKWVLDSDNGTIAAAFFAAAKIPVTAYGGASSNWKLPSQLTCCDDVYVLPHSNPTWSTHGYLLNFGSTCQSGVWMGCHGGSALIDMFNPANTDQQTNLLIAKTAAPSPGTAGPYFQNAAILWSNHSNGTPPYSYDYSGEPIMQFMGTIDAAQQNGSEQIYLPVGGAGAWYPTTHVGVYDPDHSRIYQLSSDKKYRAGTLAYGPAFGNPANGMMMLEAGHNIGGTGPANVAAQRAFFNYGFLVCWQKSVVPQIQGFSDTIVAGQGANGSITFLQAGSPTTISASNYTFNWSSSCGGTFSPSASAQSVQFTPPSVVTPTPCIITLTIQDACGRLTFNTKAVTIICSLNVTKTNTSPYCYGASNGSITMSITGGTAPYSWSWTRVFPAGSVSGTGTTISGLSAGTYNVTVTSSNGCPNSFSDNLTQPAILSATASTTSVSCFGGTGAIDLTASGGTAPYTYSWADGPTTEDRSGVSAGTYTVTVTDAKGCTAVTSATLTGPSSALAGSAVTTNVLCFGGTNGAIDLTVTGGTLPYTYNWGGGIITQDRGSLLAGAYSVIVTDANGCTITQSYTVSQPQLLNLSTVVTNPSCPPNAQQNGNTGAIDLTVTGGSGGYTYSWTPDNGGIIPSGQQTWQDLTGLIAGTYSVTVIDSNGCSKSASVTLNYLNPNPVQPATIIK